jgi:hypothetical protein
MKLNHIIRESRIDEYINAVMNIKVHLADGQIIGTYDPKLSSKGDDAILRRWLDQIITLYGDGQMTPQSPKLWKHRQDRVMWVMKYLKYGMAVEYGLDVIPKELKANTPGKDLTHRNASNIHVFETRFGSPPLPMEKQPDIQYILKKYAHLANEPVYKGAKSIYRMCKWFAEGGNNEKNSLGDIMHTMINYHAAAPNNALERIVWQEQTMIQLIEQCVVQVKKLEEFFKDCCPQQGTMLLDMGDGTSWWDLEASYVPAEGHALGHCGNVAHIPGQETLISYRESLETQGMKRMRPIMTFIYHFNDGGYFGEMKGRGNTKPAERYHPAIVAMLKLPKWNRVMGTTRDAKGNMRHSPEQNFCLFVSPGMNRPMHQWSDLSPDLAKDLHDANQKIWQYNGECQYCHNVYPGWESLAPKIVGHQLDKNTYRCAKVLGIEDELLKNKRYQQDQQPRQAMPQPEQPAEEPDLDDEFA